MKTQQKQFKIDNEYILSLNPCADRHKNYLQHYRNTSFSVVEFLKLDKITYADKIWVWRHFVEKVDAVKFAIAYAESVLPIFQSNFPDDNRPRKAIEAARKWCEEQTEENRRAASAAAADAADAWDAAYVNAVWDAADAAAAAWDAADAAWDAVYAAAAHYAAEDREAQELLHLNFLIEIYERKELGT